MSNELTRASSEIQRSLWGKLIGVGIGKDVNSGFNKRVQQARSGHLPRGVDLETLVATSSILLPVLGQFSPRVLMASEPAGNAPISPVDIAVAGGWCALRTKDVTRLSEERVLTDPLTGEASPLVDVEQFANWITRSASFDQIVESVGAVNAGEYAVISESGLWSRRMNKKISELLSRKLSPAEKALIEEAIEVAEIKRATMTERYLQLATGNDSLNFRRIRDDDIGLELKAASMAMLDSVYLTPSQLIQMFSKEAPIIRSSVLVWAMYSQPYFDALRNLGLITKDIVFIAEPSLHTYADNQAGNEVVQRIYQGRGIYLDPKGINPNTGFIAFLECVTNQGVNVRKNLTVGQVPNVSNWRMFLASGMLDPEQNLTINPVDNNLFVWGLNLSPFGDTQQRLLNLVALQRDFLKEKSEIGRRLSQGAKNNPSFRSRIQGAVEQLRREYLKRIGDENQQIAANLTNFFTALAES